MVYISVPWASRWVAKACLRQWIPRPRLIPAFFLPCEKFGEPMSGPYVLSDCNRETAIVGADMCASIL